MFRNDEVAEWSKAVDSGSIPKGRGFKSRPHHFFLFHQQSNLTSILEYDLYIYLLNKYDKLCFIFIVLKH